MVRVIKENLMVEKEGTLEIRHPELTAGSRAEVIILIEKPAPNAEPGPEHPARTPIWEIAGQIAGAVPDEEWRKLPRDLSKNVDHYLHGAPKDEG